ncbi:RagB/SusD family nutrient uptake outer membrane protein [uncultured Bacteroides sp.]|uniref:RagB/SusD family nutrient uptake outer membrane protein n=1 Tax=uncultured Bacteroides sp. TaxID=162156 RepID=UPI002589D5C4|nr:RagB/SusD family nutrient uptake outer membrane protein [uncultured Bacteroides sp.]
MKKYRSITAGLVASAFLVTGCSESFLEVESKTQETIDTYFTTDEHVQEAVVAAYAPMHWTDWDGDQYSPVLQASDVMGDDLWVGSASKTDQAHLHLSANYEAVPTNCVRNIWNTAYKGVKRCNDVLTYIGWAGDNLTTANATYYEAQARVLRVFYYTWLWKFYGNVPYYEVNLTSPYLTEQFQADAVYNAMIADLEGAIALKALPMREEAKNYGRVTLAMAYMLYAEIVMYQNDDSRYATALQYMKDIISSGKYNLVDDYAGIFRESGEWGTESIFEINFKDDQASRNYTDNVFVAGGTVLPTMMGPDGWVDGTDGHNNGWGTFPVRTETYNMFSEGDSRRDGTCWNAAAVGTYNPRYQDTGFFLEKYTAHYGDNADCSNDPQVNYNNNLRIYRFSETLLNAAELIARNAGSGDAKEYLNRVRKRAGLTVELEPTVDNIIEERHLEFVGEGKRYWDLVRTGKAATVLVPDEYGYRTNTWTVNKKYLPIPQSAIDSAQGSLTQNNY